jgi:ParB family chromosome partitioning protein
MQSHQLINQTSGDFEWYSPPHLVEGAREVMGSIDLDPFSSAAANERVKALRFYGPIEDGFTSAWDEKNCFCNHPFGRKLNGPAVRCMVRQYENSVFEQLCSLTYACTSELWFQPLLQRLQCFLHPRTNYYLPDGTLKEGVTKGSVMTYFGPNGDRFRKVFTKFGVVK